MIENESSKQRDTGAMEAMECSHIYVVIAHLDCEYQGR